MTIDCSPEAQAKVFAEYPTLFEHGFNTEKCKYPPSTDQPDMEKLCAWIIDNPPHKTEGSYRYKHRAENGLDFDRQGREVEGPDAGVGYVSQGQVILAAIMCGYVPVIYGQGCEFKMGVTA